MTSTLRFDRWETSAGEGIVDGTVASLGRNLLYNGAMQVAQRGTSTASITSSGYYTADRWNTSLSGLGTWTQSVEADGPTGSGFANSLKMLCTTADSSPAASDALVVLQRLEGQDVQALKFGTSSAESLTISFWVKSNVTGTYVVRLRNIDAGRHIATTYSVDASGTWEKKTVTFAGDTSGSFTNDNSSALQVDFYLGAGTDYTSGTLPSSWGTAVNANNAVGQTNLAASTSNYWQVTGVQLEAGTVATAFEHKAYGTELAECQRYYWEDSSTVLQWGFQVNVNATTRRGRMQFPSPMRAAPTMTFTGSVTPSAQNVTEYGAGFSMSAGDTTSTESMNSLKADAEL